MRVQLGILNYVTRPSESTVYQVMGVIGANRLRRKKSNGITKADREARKSDDLLKRDFTAKKPCEKCVTDIMEIPGKNGKLYVSAIFDCYDLLVTGLQWRIICALSCAFRPLKTLAKVSVICEARLSIQIAEISTRAKIPLCNR